MSQPENFWSDETGQATTEYIMILLVVVPLVLLLVKKVIQPGFIALSNYANQALEQQLFGADLHTFHVHR